MKNKIIVCVLLGLILGMLLCGSALAAETYGDYTYYVNSDKKTVTIKKYNGTDFDVTVPESIGGLTVTVLDSYSFKDNKTLVNVIIPDSVTTIGNASFSGCSND